MPLQNKNCNDILVAVYMITYNHCDYIAEAIKSVLAQKVNFRFKLFIGDDSSLDGTREICQDFVSKYPDIIEFEYNSENIGASNNALKVFGKCFKSGAKYIAMLEGDDYWTNEYKLQNQIDFLESNVDFSLCFHKTLMLDKDGKLHESCFNLEDRELTYSINELACRNFIHTASVLFRNPLSSFFPDWYCESPAGDYVLHMLNAKRGLIKYFPQAMAVYRKHGGGVWSTLGMQKGYEKWIEVLNFLLREDFERGVRENLLLQRRSYSEQLLQSLMNEKQWPEFLEKIGQYAIQDDFIAREWATKYYPRYIARLTGGRIYRLGNEVRKKFARLKGGKR